MLLLNTSPKYLTFECICVFHTLTQMTMSLKEVSKQALKQNRFHDYYFTERHTGIEGWVITLIERADTLKELRKKELY